MKKAKALFVLFLLMVLLGGCAAQKNQISSPNSLDSQLDDLTNQLVQSLSREKKSKIAIMDFSDLQDSSTKLGRYIAEELTTRLYRSGQFEVIERRLLDKVLEEHQMSLSGLIDESSAKKLGMILGVDAIASGTISDLGRNVKINARLINAESGKIFSAASASVFKDDGVKNLLNENIVRGGSSLPGGAESGPAESSFKKQVVLKNGIKFELKNCQRIGESIQVSVAAINSEDKTSRLTIWFLRTKMFDDAGNEHSVEQVSMAGKKSPTLSAYGGGWGSSSRSEKDINAGIPMPVKLLFEKISTDVRNVPLLKIDLGSYVGFVEFRDITINN